MNHSRIARTAGAVAAALLGITVLPAVIAFADTFSYDPGSYTFDPVGSEKVTGIYNLSTAPPDVSESTQGYQQFTVMQDGTNVGTFSAFTSTYPNLNPDPITRVLLVSPDVPGAETTGIAPPDGSVFAFSSYGSPIPNLVQNAYAAIPGANGAPGVVQDFLVTPLGSLNISWLPQLFGFDAADLGQTLPDYIKAVDDPTVAAVTALPPLAAATQGYGTYEFVNGDQSVGQFQALETTTKDVLGYHTQALLVTDTGTSATGTDLTQVPPDGSVFNTIVFPWGWTNVYSSLPAGDSQNVVTDMLDIPLLGNVNMSWLFQGFDPASGGLAEHSPTFPFYFGDGYTVGPAEGAQEVFTGVNGLPPMTTAIQGYQTFDVYHGEESVGSFTADVTTMPHMPWSRESEALLVTDTGDAATGSEPGNVPPVGTVLDYVDYGNGFQNVYWSIPSATGGPSEITDYLIAPIIGPINVSWLWQGTDASLGMGDATHAGGAWFDSIGAPTPDAPLP